jgi:hypothetical protein
MPQHKREIYTINGLKKLKCSICKYKLPFEDYDNDSRTSTGKSSYCKVCRKSKYDDKRNVPSNSGIIGLFLYQCPVCKLDFTTKKSNKTYCTDKCRKRDWYIKNERPIHLNK